MPLKQAPIAHHYILPKRALTRFAGVLANVKVKWIKNYLIRNFIRDYRVNMQEAIKFDVDDYACFNDFFIRRLKPDAREISKAEVVSPVDGVISEMGEITSGKLMQAKGLFYSVQDLLACTKESSALFESGHFMTLYLSPKDYHRVHMPIEGTLKEMLYVPGRLFSVQPKTASLIPHLFARNERLVVYFDTPLGAMVMVLVGATVVGAIGTSWHGDVRRLKTVTRFDYSSASNMNVVLRKAEEMGYFKLGSTVVLLFAKNANVQWNEHLQAGDSIRLGEALV